MFLLAQLFALTPKAGKRVFEFFATSSTTDHTRKTHLMSLLRPVSSRRTWSSSTSQQLCMLFDGLVIGHVIEVNLAYTVCGPNIIVKKDNTPVLAGGKDGLRSLTRMTENRPRDIGRA